MNPRTTGILFLVAAALGAGVYFYEIRGEESRKQAEEASKRLFAGVEAEDVEWIELATSDASSARLERRDGHWLLTRPVEFPGDEFAADGIASTLAQLTSEQVIESPQPPEVYGLGEGARELRFAAGGAEHSLKSGSKTPVGANSYVMTGAGGSVYTVATYRVSALEKSLFDLREKRPLRFDPVSVTRLAASWPGGRVVLERGEEGWRLLEPVAGPADERSLEKLLSDLSFLRAVGFQDESMPDEASGLAQPEFEVELTVTSDAAAEGEGKADEAKEEEAEAEEGGEAEKEKAAAGEPRSLRLAIGASLDGKHRLARAAEPSLYRLDAARLDDLPRSVAAYRFKQLADFEETDAARVEFVFHPEGAPPQTLVATRGESGWKAEPRDFKAGMLSRVVRELASLTATDIVADSMGTEELKGLHLTPARATITVYGSAPEAGGEPPQLAQILLGDLRSDRGVVAQSAGNPMVFELDYQLAEHLPLSLDAFENRFEAKPEAAAAEEGSADAAPEGAEPSEEPGDLPEPTDLLPPEAESP